MLLDEAGALLLLLVLDELGPPAFDVEQLSLAEIVGGGGIGGRPFGKETLGTTPAGTDVAPVPLAPTMPLELRATDLENEAVDEDGAPPGAARDAPPLPLDVLLEKPFIASGGADIRMEPAFEAADALWSPEEAVASMESGRRGGNRSFILSRTLASSKPMFRAFGVKPKRAIEPFIQHELNTTN